MTDTVRVPREHLERLSKLDNSLATAIEAKHWALTMLAASPQGEGSSADADTHRAAEGVALATVIRENLLGVRPDDQAVALEDDDWRLILASLERFGASDRPRR